MEAKGLGRDQQEQLMDQMWAIQDVQGEIHERDRAFDAAMDKKQKYLSAEAKKKQGVGRFKFRLFNLRDNEKLYKNYCWSCENGRKCHKHAPPELKRKIEALRNEE